MQSHDGSPPKQVSSGFTGPIDDAWQTFAKVNGLPVEHPVKAAFYGGALIAFNYLMGAVQGDPKGLLLALIANRISTDINGFLSDNESSQTKH